MLLASLSAAAVSSAETPPSESVRGLTFDYVPWEQMSKQRRGIMWAMQLAKAVDRTLLLPPLRFHTPEKDVFKYVPYSELFELAPLARVHPTFELTDTLHGNGRQVDLVFSNLKGRMPESAAKAAASNAEWVAGECAHKTSCQVNAQGREEVCVTRSDFAGVEDVQIHNLTCGWTRAMRWDLILRAHDVKDAPIVGIGAIVYQIPPPVSMAELSSFVRARDAGAETCGWRCPYTHIRSGMVYRSGLVEAATGFLRTMRERLADPDEASRSASSGPVRVLAVHWRRGDFLNHRHSQGVDVVCTDEATGQRLQSTATAGARECPCATVILPPHDLAKEISGLLELHNASVVFLASNAKEDEVDELKVALPDIPIARFEPEAVAASALDVAASSASAPMAFHYTDAELAVMDTLICSLADAFLGTRRSMFSWNILEERVLQGKDARTGRLMGLRT